MQTQQADQIDRSITAAISWKNKSTAMPTVDIFSAAYLFKSLYGETIHSVSVPMNLAKLAVYTDHFRALEAGAIPSFVPGPSLQNFMDVCKLYSRLPMATVFDFTEDGDQIEIHGTPVGEHTDTVVLNVL